MFFKKVAKLFRSFIIKVKIQANVVIIDKRASRLEIFIRMTRN